ncbi:hypothetical protein [Halodurantibacterium flavum]|uniref:Uncharacterized protein n=1 Tax=Halodurantibacterium flavum TaxID=1382802 RepID=A0ABW4S2G4_9RHOB
MRTAYVFAILFSALGVMLALIALAAPFGNTGVDGTLGAGLALLGSVATTMLIAIFIMSGLTRGWFIALNSLAMLAAFLTALAAFFLMQTLLAIAMVAAFLTMAFAFLRSNRRTT